MIFLLESFLFGYFTPFEVSSIREIQQVELSRNCFFFSQEADDHFGGGLGECHPRLACHQEFSRTTMRLLAGEATHKKHSSVFPQHPLTFRYFWAERGLNNLKSFPRAGESLRLTHFDSNLS